MVRARGLGVLMAATLLPFALACGSTGGGGGGTASTCKPDSVSYVPAGGSAVAAAVAPRLGAIRAQMPPMATNTVIKIGFIGILSGQYKDYGVDEQYGVQLAIEAANQAGITVNGTSYTLQLDSQDDAADATKGAQGATKLVDDKVVAVIGGTFSTATIAESKIFSDNGITQISPSATNDKYTSQGFKTAFRVVGHDNQQGGADSAFMVKTLGCKNVGVIDDKSSYGQGLADNVAKAIPLDGGTVVDREHVDKDQTDFSAQLTAIKGHNPEIIFFGGYSPQLGPMISQARRQGIKATFVSGDGSHNETLFKLAGNAALGTFTSDAGPDPTLQPGYKDFEAKYKAKFNVGIFQYSPQAFDAANIIINAIKKAGPDKAGILKAVGETDNYQGVAQIYSFTSTGDVKLSIFTIYKVTGAYPYKAVKAVTLNVT
ncbi:MAG: branched-chain amino acid ABC transporter substrate-binding protein [Candidatus Dormibacteraeota bacterium]|nr:branched-chain amino acid ABC transporter substrate-binding protein [Candidatus Dormibacteraeota bacterium]